MALFYRGRYAAVTDRIFDTWLPERRSYRVRDLRQVCVTRRRDDVQPLVVLRPLCVGGAVGLAIVLVAPQLQPAAVMAVVPLAIGALRSAVRWYRSRVYELWALVDGGWACLFVCADPVMFGQVRRGLQRSVEWNRDAL
jgi:hypothetical protein